MKPADPHEDRRKRLASFVERAASLGLRTDRAVGGYNAHALEATGREALCGFEPSNREGSTMASTERGSWSGDSRAIRCCGGCAFIVADRFNRAVARLCACGDVSCWACGPSRRAK